MNGKPIAIFDSGVGGLTVLREVSRRFPSADIVYLGDTARVPYGIKSRKTVRRFALENARFLMRFNPSLMIVACNTASANAVDTLRKHLPIPVVDVVEPGAHLAATLTRKKIVAVIATESTVRSGAYPAAVKAVDPGITVHSRACPLLVPIVEEGRDSDDPIVRMVLEEYLEPLLDERPDVLILGCTHYPVLRKGIAAVAGDGIHIVESGPAITDFILTHHPKEIEAADGKGKLRIFATDNAERFRETAERIVALPVDEVTEIDVAEIADH